MRETKKEKWERVRKKTKRESKKEKGQRVRKKTKRESKKEKWQRVRKRERERERDKANWIKQNENETCLWNFWQKKILEKNLIEIDLKI